MLNSFDGVSSSVEVSFIDSSWVSELPGSQKTSTMHFIVRSQGLREEGPLDRRRILIVFVWGSVRQGWRCPYGI